MHGEMMLAKMAGAMHTGLNVKMEKEKLLSILKTNREQHETDFKKAIVIWQGKMAESLRETAKLVEEGKKVDLHHAIHSYPMPMNMTATYDRLIKMLEHTTEETIELDENQYSQFVEDEWHWSAQTRAINSTYLGN